MTTQKNTRYAAHFLMTAEDIKDYIVQRAKLFPATDSLEVHEIGDGNINYVYRIVDTSTGKTAVVKQADKYLRSSGRELDLSRNRIEAEILQIQHNLVPEYIPEIYFYDETISALVMEDISAYRNMRYELIERKRFPNFSEQISDFLARVLLPTTDLIDARDRKKRRVRDFTNSDMCDISEDLVLTEPYVDYKKRNIITAGNETFVEKHLYHDAALHQEVAWLRDHYMNHPQALIHGDLHTGSIFVQQTGMKIIDPEFAFYGPIGYDVGNVLAHLYFPFVLNLFSADADPEFHNWSLTTIQEVYDRVKEKFAAVYDDQVKLPLYRNEAFKQAYIAQIMADTLGYAGTEIIRRVVGDSKVKELALLAADRKLPAERLLLQSGIRLIKQRQKITSGQELLDLLATGKEGS